MVSFMAACAEHGHVLDAALAVRSGAEHNDTERIVLGEMLEGAGDDLAGGGGAFVHEDDDGDAVEAWRCRGGHAPGGRWAPAGGLVITMMPRSMKRLTMLTA